MDGAWAMYEAWIRLQEGDIDLALVVRVGQDARRASRREIYPLQMDPYTLTPLGADPVSLAGMQARAMIDAGKLTERDMAEIVARSRRNAESNPHAQVKGERGRRRPAEGAVLHGAAAQARPPADLRRRDRGHPGDGRQGPPARRPSGVDPRHRPPHRHPPTRHARPHGLEVDRARRQGRRRRRRAGRVRRAVRARSRTQEKILRDALGPRRRRRRSTRPAVRCAANPMMAVGLARIVEAAAPDRRGRPHARRRPRDVAARACSRTSSASSRGTDP